jgi:hypothetical protein
LDTKNDVWVLKGIKTFHDYGRECMIVEDVGWWCDSSNSRGFGRSSSSGNRAWCKRNGTCINLVKIEAGKVGIKVEEIAMGKDDKLGCVVGDTIFESSGEVCFIANAMLSSILGMPGESHMVD